MTNEERVALIQAGENVAENLEKLFFDNLGLWVYAIKPFTALVEFEELKQEAFLTVAEAAKQYKPERGAFSSFAVMKIRQEIPVYISSYSSFSIPEWWITVQGKFADLVRSGVTGDRELARRLGVKMSDVELLRRSVVSANIPAYEEEERTELIETIPAPDDTEAEAVELIGSEELRQDVWEEVERVLDAKRLEIIKALFLEGESIGSLAERLGCTHQYISAERARALDRLERSEKLQKIAEDYAYISIFMYRGGVENFNITNTSCVERYVLVKDRLDQRKRNIVERMLKRQAELKEIERKRAELYAEIMKKNGGISAPAK